MATKPKKPATKGKKPSKAGGSARGSNAGKATAGKSAKPDKGKPLAGKKAAEADLDPDEPRRLGIRGAAPWAARHAAKHAAEARARAAEPPPPGSARATLRVPTGAEEIKARIVHLHNILLEIKTLRKNLTRNFFAIGRLLREIREDKLYEVRGFGSFEAFLDREVDLGKTTSMRLARVVEVFQEEAALFYGMDHVLQALATLESGQRQGAGTQPLAAGSSPPPLPMRPPAPRK